MSINRRVFLASIIGTACGFALSTIKAASKLGTLPVIYTVTGENDESVMKYLELIDNKGIKENNRKLYSAGLILEKTPFKRVSNGKWECMLVFESKAAFEKFLNSSRPILSDAHEFQKTHDIRISLKEAA